MYLGFAGIDMRFGKTSVLEGFDLELERGESVALLGPSGCGKTTALRIAAGFLKADRGQVFLEGEDISASPPERRQMALIHQQFLLFPHLTSSENIAFGMSYRGVRPPERKKRAEGLLERMGLAGLGARYPHELSGGQQQRVAIARALAVEPRVLLLDEPLNNLDSSIRERLLGELRALHRESGMTMLYVTHDWTEASRIADRLAVLDRGRILQTASFEEILARPASRRVAGMFGARNIYDAVGDTSGLRVPDLEMSLAAATRTAGPLLIYIPADRLKLGVAGDGRIGFRGQVEEILGDPLCSRLRIRRGAGIVELVATRPALAEAGAMVGAFVDFSFRAEDIHVLPDEN